MSSDQYARHEQLMAVQAAFTRFNGDGVAGTIERHDLPNFIRFVVASMNAAATPQNEIIEQSSVITRRFDDHLPSQASRISLADIMDAAAKGLPMEASPDSDEVHSGERGYQGSKQLQLLRKKLERNRLTMPLFDTKGWVRDFEKALKIQWEIYANGLAPMHIVVSRSDHIYGTDVLVR